MKKTFFLTLDLEEWYHLEYFKDLAEGRSGGMLAELGSFFDLLDNYEIKITVFILGELIEDHRELILEINRRGHEIGIHGWNHDLLHAKENDEFIKEVIRTKNELENLTGQHVVGYRAPCFSMSNDKFDLLNSIGIRYDSSFIQFAEHPLYGSMSMDNFEKVDDLIFRKSGVYEFELPTLKFLGKSIPISGGGYFRLFPKIIFRRLLALYFERSKNFNMYIHPFELTDIEPDLSGFKFRNKYRFRVGRRNNLKKLEWLLKLTLSEGCQFSTIRGYIQSQNKGA